MPGVATGMTTDASAPVRIDVWSDIACPWCAIGAARLDRAIRIVEERGGEAPDFDVRFHAFQLDPGAQHTELSHAEDLARRKGLSVEQIEQMFTRVAEAGEEDELVFAFDRVRSASTRRGHELIAFAATQGRQREAVDALHHAYFTEGVDVEDLEALVGIATSIGLDGDTARSALTSHEFETQVDIDLDEATRLGVSGVPFFVVDQQYAFSGAQPAATVVQVIDHVLQERRAASA